MKTCPNCGKQCVDQAVKCPKCKASFNDVRQNNSQSNTISSKRNLLVAIIMWIMSAVFLFAGIAGCTASYPIAGIAFMFIAVVLNPLVIDFATPRIGFFKKGWFKAVAIVSCLAIITININMNPVKNTGTDKPLSVSVPQSTSSKNVPKASSSPNSKEDTETSSKTISETPKPDTIKITASELLAAYDENGVKADEDYKGKLIEVTGVVKSIDKDVFDSIYITLGSGNEFELLSVQCYFEDSETSKVSEIKKDSEITIIGTCKGSSLNILLKKCTIQ